MVGEGLWHLWHWEQAILEGSSCCVMCSLPKHNADSWIVDCLDQTGSGFGARVPDEVVFSTAVRVLSRTDAAVDWSPRPCAGDYSRRCGCSAGRCQVSRDVEPEFWSRSDRLSRMSGTLRRSRIGPAPWIQRRRCCSHFSVLTRIAWRRGARTRRVARPSCSPAPSR